MVNLDNHASYLIIIIAHIMYNKHEQSNIV